jgi:hypothetical protein
MTFPGGRLSCSTQVEPQISRCLQFGARPGLIAKLLPQAPSRLGTADRRSITTPAPLDGDDQSPTKLWQTTVSRDKVAGIKQTSSGEGNAESKLNELLPILRGQPLSWDVPDWLWARSGLLWSGRDAEFLAGATAAAGAHSEEADRCGPGAMLTRKRSVGLRGTKGKYDEIAFGLTFSTPKPWDREKTTQCEDDRMTPRERLRWRNWPRLDVFGTLLE